MKTLILAAVLSVFSVLTFAGEHHEPKHSHGEKKLQKMTQKLDLTGEQQQAIKNIYTQAKEQKQALDKKYNIDAYRQEKRAIAKERKQAVAKVLTDEQKEKMKKMKSKHKKNMRKQH